MANKATSANKNQSFVSDGCTLNSIVYLKTKVKNADKNPKFSEFCELAIKNAKKYDFIIYLPPELPLVDDGFRPLSPEFRSEINHLLLDILKDYKFYTVRGELKERIKQIKDIIKN
ncbi:MAG: AAA family ATPase [Candidatus Zambryskibacteria bacterium]|nr:AAA family ATPase [Candidatus Zambryskibacteria bacterium]